MINSTKEDYEVMVQWAQTKEKRRQKMDEIQNLKVELRKLDKQCKEFRLYFVDVLADYENTSMVASPIEYKKAEENPERVQYIVEKNGNIIKLRKEKFMF